jgi:hypothetical protein
MWEEAVVTYFKVLSQNFPGEIKKTMKKLRPRFKQGKSYYKTKALPQHQSA